MADVTASRTDYDAIGGAGAVSTVVDRFYELVLADPELAGFFADTDLARLKRHQVLLISQVLGGPAQYDGRDLHDAHAGRQIGDAHYGRVCAYLVTALHEAGVPIEIIGRVGAVLGSTRPQVVEVAG